MTLEFNRSKYVGLVIETFSIGVSVRNCTVCKGSPMGLVFLDTGQEVICWGWVCLERRLKRQQSVRITLSSHERNG